MSDDKDFQQAGAGNMGEMTDADAVGTAGSAGCGDMMRLWVKYKEGKDGQKVIDQASFQGFGCETAIAVAGVATELIKGKTASEAMTMSGQELSAPLGPLPPMKIHCATLVEEALRQALQGGGTVASDLPADSGALNQSVPASRQEGPGKIVFMSPESKEESPS